MPAAASNRTSISDPRATSHASRVATTREKGKGRSCNAVVRDRHHRPPRGRRHTWRVPESGHLLPFPQAPDGIELRHLRAFVAVAEELNFGRAAERLYISQPALSRQIRALEQFVGCELLSRSTHRVELTIAGEALLDRARKLLLDVDEAVAETLAVGGELLGRAVKTARAARRARRSGGRPARGPSDIRASPGRVRVALGNRGTPSHRRWRAVAVVSPVDQPEPTVLYLHGGGYVLGSAFGYQAHAGALAAARTYRCARCRLPSRSRASVPGRCGGFAPTRTGGCSTRASPAKRVTVAGDSPAEDS